MMILAIDTALGAVSACVYDSVTLRVLASEREQMLRGHAEVLMPLLDRVTAQFPTGFAGLERVAVTVGPGSFTGIRIGVSAARAIGLACAIPVVGVSTLAALAAPLVLPTERGSIAAAIDARHGHIYLAIFSANGAVVLAPRVAPLRDAARLLGSDKVRLCGSGAPMLAIEAWNIGLNAEVTGELIAPDIAFVARLGALADPAGSSPRPMYLKAPDAKPKQARIATPPAVQD